MYALDLDKNRLYRRTSDGGHWYDPETRLWHDAAVPRHVTDLSAAEALAWRQKDSGFPMRSPIGVIGPREDNVERNVIAENVGRALGGVGLTVMCGGRGGVMQAVARGVAASDGLCIGILPESDTSEANPYVTVTIASGIGEARNAIIACGAEALVVIGDSYGTLSEVALGLRFGKTVLGLCQPPQVNGVQELDDVSALLPALAAHLLR